MNKKIIVVIVLGILVVGGLSMLFLNKKEDTPANTNQQTGESYDQMMARMHPTQQSNNDMSSHHGGSSSSSNDDMSSHHGGSTPVSTDNTNTGMTKFSFASAVGQKAPDFTLTKRDGSPFKLSDYQDKTIVLFFNEGSMCYPACWNQMASLGNDKRFNTGNVITASIVIDAKDKWDKIISSQPKYGVGTILFDTNKAVSGAYDVLNVPSSMHKGSFPGHTYVIIKQGVITYVLDDPNMALNNEFLVSKL